MSRQYLRTTETCEHLEPSLAARREGGVSMENGVRFPHGTRMKEDATDGEMSERGPIDLSLSAVGARPAPAAVVASPNNHRQTRMPVHPAAPAGRPLHSPCDSEQLGHSSDVYRNFQSTNDLIYERYNPAHDTYELVTSAPNRHDNHLRVPANGPKLSGDSRNISIAQPYTRTKSSNRSVIYAGLSRFTETEVIEKIHHTDDESLSIREDRDRQRSIGEIKNRNRYIEEVLQSTEHSGSHGEYAKLGYLPGPLNGLKFWQTLIGYFSEVGHLHNSGRSHRTDVQGLRREVADFLRNCGLMEDDDHSLSDEINADLKRIHPSAVHVLQETSELRPEVERLLAKSSAFETVRPRCTVSGKPQAIDEITYLTDLNGSNLYYLRKESDYSLGGPSSQKHQETGPWLKREDSYKNKDYSIRLGSDADAYETYQFHGKTPLVSSRIAQPEVQAKMPFELRQNLSRSADSSAFERPIFRQSSTLTQCRLPWTPPRSSLSPQPSSPNSLLPPHLSLLPTTSTPLSSPPSQSPSSPSSLSPAASLISSYRGTKEIPTSNTELPATPIKKRLSLAAGYASKSLAKHPSKYSNDRSIQATSSNFQVDQPIRPPILYEEKVPVPFKRRRYTPINSDTNANESSHTYERQGDSSVGGIPSSRGTLPRTRTCESGRFKQQNSGPETSNEIIRWESKKVNCPDAKHPVGVETSKTAYYNSLAVLSSRSAEGRPNLYQDSITNPSSAGSTKRPSAESPRDLKCSICSIKYLTQREHSKHMATVHGAEKPNICGYCGKGFQDKFDLKRHHRTHTGVRPYKCHVCPRAFTQRCSLETHCSKVHGLKLDFAFKERRKKLFVCEECGNAENEAYTHYLHTWVQHARLDMPKRLLQKVMRRTKKSLGADMAGMTDVDLLSKSSLITQTLCSLRGCG